MLVCDAELADAASAASQVLDALHRHNALPAIEAVLFQSPFELVARMAADGVMPIVGRDNALRPIAKLTASRCCGPVTPPPLPTRKCRISRPPEGPSHYVSFDTPWCRQGMANLLVECGPTRGMRGPLAMRANGWTLRAPGAGPNSDAATVAPESGGGDAVWCGCRQSHPGLDAPRCAIGATERQYGPGRGCQGEMRRADCLMSRRRLLIAISRLINSGTLHGAARLYRPSGLPPRLQTFVEPNRITTGSRIPCLKESATDPAPWHRHPLSTSSQVIKPFPRGPIGLLWRGHLSQIALRVSPGDASRHL